MSYLVLARKYRPKTFSEVVGQEHVTRTLANAFAKDRVHHAFLFCGPRGVGKTTLARILGKALNCENGPTDNPCGSCSACETITNGSAVDYFEMDGASNRGIDAIRELTEAVRYQPAVLRKKVYVIDEVHMLTTEAFNALLKTLEEPPPHVCFVLATTEPHKVPNTILSRCQRYDFKLVPAPRLSEHISTIFAAESLAIEPGAISLIVRESGGSVRDSLSLCDQIISYVSGEQISEVEVAEVLGVADRSLTRSLVTSLAQGDIRNALEAVASAVERGVDEVQLARAIVRYLRDLAVVHAAPKSDKLIEGSAEERSEIAEQARAIQPGRVIQMFDRMVRACEDLGQTQQPRLVLDLALIEVAAIEPVVPLGDLLDRLGALERYLSSGGGGGGGGNRRPPPRKNPPPRNPPPSRNAAPPRNTAPPDMRHDRPPPDMRHDRPPPAEPFGAETQAPAPPREPPPREAPASRPPPESAQTPPPPESAQMPPPPVKSATTPTNGAARVHPSDPIGEWETVLDALHDAGKPAVSSCFRQAKVLHWNDTGVALGFAPTDTYAYEMVTSDGKLDEIKAFLAERYGGWVAIDVRMLKDTEAGDLSSAQSVHERDRQRVAEERKKRHAEVHVHPIYNKVIETFGAPIKEEINTDV